MSMILLGAVCRATGHKNSKQCFSCLRFLQNTDVFFLMLCGIQLQGLPIAFSGLYVALWKSFISQNFVFRKKKLSYFNHKYWSHKFNKCYSSIKPEGFFVKYTIYVHQYTKGWGGQILCESLVSQIRKKKVCQIENRYENWKRVDVNIFYI